MPHFRHLPRQPTVRANRQIQPLHPHLPSAQAPAPLAAASSGASLPWCLPLQRRKAEERRLGATEKAESAVQASQRRRAPKPGGTQRMRWRLRKPRKSSPVQRGRQDQPTTRPIMTAAQIGTAQSSTSTAISAIAGRRSSATASSHHPAIAARAPPSSLPRLEFPLIYFCFFQNGGEGKREGTTARDEEGSFWGARW
jgi:hypothetical protein